MSDKKDIQLNGKRIVGETIELHSQNTISFISGGTELIDCDVRIRCSASNYMLLDAALTNCRVWAHKPQNSASFTKTKFYNCRFKGRFNDCEFGDTFKNGCVKDCDFTEATLKDCFFFDTELSDAVWPDWPHLALCNLYKNKDDWLAINFPDKFRIWQDICATHYKANRIQIINLELNKDVDSPEEFWALVQDKDYVFFPDMHLKEKHLQEYVDELSRRNSKERADEDERLSNLLLHEVLTDGKIAGYSFENNSLTVELNMEVVREYVESFPASLSVLFNNVSDVTLQSKDGKETFPLSSLKDRNFKILSVSDEKAQPLVLKGQSKKAGNLHISGDINWTLTNEDISPVELKKLRKEYYKIRYNIDDDDW